LLPACTTAILPAIVRAERAPKSISDWNMRASRPHLGIMKTHPHGEATYRVVSTASGAFAVEVTIPDTHPTTVSSFPTEQAAEAWIARNKQRVAAEGQAGRWFQKPARGNLRT
jgi:hypothetical protein